MYNYGIISHLGNYLGEFNKMATNDTVPIV